MAEDKEQDKDKEVEEKETPAKPKGTPMAAKIVKVLIGVAILAVMLGFVFLATYLFTQKVKMDGLPVEPGVRPGQDQATEPPLTFDMNKFTVIIFDEAGRNYNLRVWVLLTVNSERPDHVEATNELGLRKDQLTDAIYEVLIAMNPKNFMGSPTERSQGMAELKASIIRAVNARMKHKIDGCFLKEFIFQ